MVFINLENNSNIIMGHWPLKELQIKLHTWGNMLVTLFNNNKRPLKKLHIKLHTRENKLVPLFNNTSFHPSNTGISNPHQVIDAQLRSQLTKERREGEMGGLPEKN